MCEFTRERLHSPFTMATAQAMSRGDKAYQKEIKDKAINVFDTVQKFMRQRNSLKIPLRLHELLTDCVRHEFLRDEAYIGIIKQCINNADEDPNVKPELKVNALNQVRAARLAPRIPDALPCSDHCWARVCAMQTREVRGSVRA